MGNKRTKLKIQNIKENVFEIFVVMEGSVQEVFKF